jgi:transcriptional regulator of arginine metabolism
MTRDHSATRRLAIRNLLVEHRVPNQAELTKLLAAAGHRVTQTTISRDLKALQATKTTDSSGRTCYRIDTVSRPQQEHDRLRRVLADYLVQALPSDNLVVLKVHPATAGTVAAALDATPPDGVLGTLAGDDTVLVVADGDIGGAAVAAAILRVLEA